MSDYCNCCASNTEHIRQHYDPDALTKPTDDAAEVLDTFSQCFPGACPLTVEEVQEYIDAIREEA